MKKLSGVSGETLVETLFALLIITMTSILFLNLTLSSGRIAGEARAYDVDYQRSLSIAEEQSEVIGSGAISIGSRSYPVTYFGSDDAQNRLVSYAAAEGAP